MDVNDNDGNDRKRPATGPDGSRMDPICLTDDEEGSPIFPVKKRPRSNNENESVIKLFATIGIDDSSGQRHGQHPGVPFVGEYCRTLRDILGFNDKLQQGTGTSMDWLVVSNYIVDFAFLLDEVPELLSCPTTVVFYGATSQVSAIDAWRQCCTNEKDGSCSVHFQQLCPSDPPLTSTNPLPFSVSAPIVPYWDFPLP